MARRVRVGALDIEYDEYDEAGQAAGGTRPFVLVHGLCGSRDDFADVLEPLARLGRTLVADQRGHGGTSNPGEGYTLEQLVADLEGFLDASGVDGCDLLGHSLGGMVALRLALARPEKIASLVLMDTLARSHTETGHWAYRLIGSVSRRVPLRWFWRVLRANRRRLPEPMRRAEQLMGSERYWERLRIKLDAMDPVALDGLLRAMLGQRPLTDRLAEMRCPTLILVGEEDRATFAGCRELADGIPDAKLVVIKGAHHSPQIETPEAWLEAIRTHLERARA